MIVLVLLILALACAVAAVAGVSARINFVAWGLLIAVVALILERLG